MRFIQPNLMYTVLTDSTGYFDEPKICHYFASNTQEILILKKVKKRFTKSKVKFYSLFKQFMKMQQNENAFYGLLDLWNNLEIGGSADISEKKDRVYVFCSGKLIWFFSLFDTTFGVSVTWTSRATQRTSLELLLPVTLTSTRQE